MSAIITSRFRYQTAKNILEALGGNGPQAPESYYLFLGRSFSWPSDSTPTVPVDRPSDENDAIQNMIAMKKILPTAISHAIPRYNWISGTTYAEYDDADSALLSTKQFYVLTDELNLYKCIKAGTGPSIIKPTGNDTELGLPLADGYQWKYMFTLTGNNVNRFLTSTFMPVETLDENVSGIGALQWAVQEDAIDGGVHRIRMISGGVGYQSTPTVTITGNGTGAVVEASDITIVGGVITQILVKPNNAGSGYSAARVTITGGNPTTPATARAVISPIGGHGSDPVKELGGYFLVINTQLVSDEGSGDFIIDNDFRQVGIIRNPIDANTGEIGVESTYSALTTLNYSGINASSFTKDQTITGLTSGAVAYIDSSNSSDNSIKVHQNFTTGFRAFQVGEVIQAGSVTATLDSIDNPEIELNTGEIIYIENLSPVNRNISQTEDIKLVLEL
jgi:hypothetical protein